MYIIQIGIFYVHHSDRYFLCASIFYVYKSDRYCSVHQSDRYCYVHMSMCISQIGIFLYVR